MCCMLNVVGYVESAHTHEYMVLLAFFYDGSICFLTHQVRTDVYQVCTSIYPHAAIPVPEGTYVPSR